MSGIHYTSYTRPVPDGFEYGYIEQALGHIDISKGVQGATIRAKTHHVQGLAPTFEDALRRMQELPLKSYGGVADDE